MIAAPLDEEISTAPLEVQALYAQMKIYAETVDIAAEAQALRPKRTLTRVSSPPNPLPTPCTLAVATVNDCELIVSWNFRHIVRFSKIQRFNAINALYGYNNLAIHSPPEVINEKDKNI